LTASNVAPGGETGATRETREILESPFGPVASTRHVTIQPQAGSHDPPDLQATITATHAADLLAFAQSGGARAHCPFVPGSTDARDCSLFYGLYLDDPHARGARTGRSRSSEARLKQIRGNSTRAAGGPPGTHTVAFASETSPAVDDPINRRFDSFEMIGEDHGDPPKLFVASRPDPDRHIGWVRPRRAGRLVAGVRLVARWQLGAALQQVVLVGRVPARSQLVARDHTQPHVASRGTALPSAMSLQGPSSNPQVRFGRSFVGQICGARGLRETARPVPMRPERRKPRAFAGLPLMRRRGLEPPRGNPPTRPSRLSAVLT
jgi:hypothetical protein